MEIYEYREENGVLSCTFYIKNKLSKECHGFKFGGQRIDDVLKELGKRDIRSFKRVHSNDLQINYAGGKVFLRNAGHLLNKKEFSGISKQLDKKSDKIGEKKTTKWMKKHLEWKSSLKRKASRPKSVANYNKKATFTKKQAFTFKFEGNKVVSTLSGTSRLTGKLFSFTYEGSSAQNTFDIVSRKNIKAFQLQKNKTEMEVTIPGGNIYIEDFSRNSKNPGMRRMVKAIEQKADKMSQKEFQRRMHPATNKTLFFNKVKSAANSGLTVVKCSVIAAAAIGTLNAAGVEMPMVDNFVNNITQFTSSYALPDDGSIYLDQGYEVTFEDNEKVVKKEVTLEYGKPNDPDKLANVQNNYSSVIEKYSEMYGLDPNVVTAIATHENGYNWNSERMAAAGLMQIEKSVWAGESVTAYNHKTKSMEKYEINPKTMTNMDENVKIGCMILRNEIDSNNGDLLYGIFSYNQGSGNMNTIVKEAMKQTGKSREQVLADYDWLDYTYASGVGDKNYLKNVLSYIPEGVEEIHAYNKDGVKNVVTINNTYEAVKTR